MATKFKILERKGRQFERPRRAEISAEAMHLVEDIWCLAMCRTLLDAVDFDSISKDRETSREIMKDLQTQLRTAHRYAQTKLRNEFLAK